MDDPLLDRCPDGSKEERPRRRGLRDPPAVASYDKARKLAEGTAVRLGVRLDLRGALRDGHGHLTFSKADCDANEWSYGTTLVQLSQDGNPTDEARAHSEQNWRTMLEGLKKTVEGER